MKNACITPVNVRGRLTRLRSSNFLLLYFIYSVFYILKYWGFYGSGSAATQITRSGTRSEVYARLLFPKRLRWARLLCLGINPVFGCFSLPSMSFRFLPTIVSLTWILHILYIVWLKLFRLLRKTPWIRIRLACRLVYPRIVRSVHLAYGRVLDLLSRNMVNCKSKCFTRRCTYSTSSILMWFVRRQKYRFYAAYLTHYQPMSPGTLTTFICSSHSGRNTAI